MRLTNKTYDRIFWFLMMILMVLLFSTYSCTDNLEVQEPNCRCDMVETITKVVTVNGMPKIKVTKIYTFYSEDCRDDGKVISDDKTDTKIVECL